MITEKTLETLELTKILAQLAKHTSFSAGRDLVLEMRPTTNIDEARAWQQEVAEVRELLEKSEGRLNLGGVRDVRDAAIAATRGVMIEASVLLDIRITLRRATTLKRTLGRMNYQYPRIAEIVEEIQECNDLQTSIETAIDDNAEIRDTASPRLAIIRRDLKVVFERLQTKLNRMITNSSITQYLQDPIITTRNGRYVVPVKSDFKGKVKGILHDTSSSGATVFIEPEATVELNNQWRELQLDEEKEIRRILMALTDDVGRLSEEIVRTVDVLAYLDLLRAKAAYADQLRAVQPVLLALAPVVGNPHPGSIIELQQARHPLIGEKVVPIDVHFGEDTWALVVTGPNTGGKTVALKTVGLMVLMAQCGLAVPCVSARMTIFEGVYADIGDEQSIEQSLSTFSSHMKNTIHILERCDEHSLVLLDEVGAGTDPAEGAALARAIIDFLVHRPATIMVTTHHPELKSYAVEKRGVRNASVEFNLETLAPTYRLIVGLPGRSNALAIAGRLGLPADIIANAREFVTNADLNADAMLDEIHRSREEVRQQSEEIAEVLATANAERLELRQRLDKLEDERRSVMVEAKRKAEQEVESFRRELRRLTTEMRAASMPLENLRAIHEVSERLLESARQPLNEADAVEVPAADVPDWRPRLGDVVWLETLRGEGTVIELDRNDAMVQMGSLKIRAAFRDLRRPTKQDRQYAEKVASRRRQGTTEYRDERPTVKAPGLELDLRGERVDEAIQRLEEYLDAAYLSGLPFARIIHGKGTGALRKAVREKLEGHSLVMKVSTGEPNEGGDGVTVIHLAPLNG
jgi:DNA mismatch repair protein MutS2